MLGPSIFVNEANTHTWTPPTPVTKASAFDFSPSVADRPEAGEIWLVYTRVPSEGNSQVMLQRYRIADQFWLPEANVSASQLDQFSPDIVRLANNTMMIAWASDVDPSENATDWDIFYRLSPSPGIWLPEFRVTSGPFNDTSASLLQAINGTLWLVWTRGIGETTRDIYFKTYDGTAWSKDKALVTDPGSDNGPMITQTRDGMIWVVWSSSRNGGQLDLFYKTYDGRVWSPETPLIIDPEGREDAAPEMIQDRNGTLWIFWSRALPSAVLPLQEDIFSAHSYDYGRTWSTWENRTFTPDVSERDATAAQMIDKRIWLFWSHLDPFALDSSLLYVRTDPIATHDIAVTRIDSPDRGRWNTTVKINVTVANNGDFNPEPVNVTLYIGTKPVGSRIGNVSRGGSVTFTFDLKTAAITPARYQLRATASIPIESIGNLSDNSLTSGTIAVSPPGDLNLDGRVDINDAARLAIAFDSRPGTPTWDPLADLNGNGIVDILDASLLAFWFDTTVP